MSVGVGCFSAKRSPISTVFEISDFVPSGSESDEHPVKITKTKINVSSFFSLLHPYSLAMYAETFLCFYTNSISKEKGTLSAFPVFEFNLILISTKKLRTPKC